MIKEYDRLENKITKDPVYTFAKHSTAYVMALDGVIYLHRGWEKPEELKYSILGKYLNDDVFIRVPMFPLNKRELGIIEDRFEREIDPKYLRIIVGDNSYYGFMGVS